MIYIKYNTGDQIWIGDCGKVVKSITYDGHIRCLGEDGLYYNPSNEQLIENDPFSKAYAEWIK